MEENLKQLLLKDLCARLPYGVKVMKQFKSQVRTLRSVDIEECKVYFAENDVNSPFGFYIENPLNFYQQVKPYLRPMSSMTEEDVQDIRNRLNNLPIGRTITKENFEKCCDFLWFTKMSSFECVSEKMMDVVIGYLDENMFDHRGLIPMGLALEAPEDMYK